MKQHTCPKCNEQFETEVLDQRYCYPCKRAYDNAYAKAHPERRRNYYNKWYGHHKPESKNRVSMRTATNTPAHHLYCPACGKKTRHVQYSKSSRGAAAKWECQSCKRNREISADELREMQMG